MEKTRDENPLGLYQEDPNLGNLGKDPGKRAFLQWKDLRLETSKLSKLLTNLSNKTVRLLDKIYHEDNDKTESMHAVDNEESLQLVKIKHETMKTAKLLTNLSNKSLSLLYTVDNMKDLYLQTRKETATTSDLNEYPLCIICMRRKRDTVFYPCTHMILCRKCSDYMNKQSSDRACPVCKKQITQRFKALII